MMVLKGAVAVCGRRVSVRRWRPFDDDRARQLCALGSFDVMMAAVLLAGLLPFAADY